MQNAAQPLLGSCCDEEVQHVITGTVTIARSALGGLKETANTDMSADQFQKSMSIGMTDYELELACEAQATGVYPWTYWTSEIYSFGKCLRFWTRYPAYLPLFVYSDHGVGLHSHLFLHELENSATVHFTWNPVKEQRYRDKAAKKEVIQVVHPWISYRRSKGITRSKEPKGTLAFFMHGTTAVKWEGHDSVDYFERLRNLPSKFQPIVLCLHSSDITAGLHKELRRHGFPIVTAGNTQSTNFVDRFYEQVGQYSFATAPAWGSYAAYCVEFGVSYFQLGNRPELVNIADPNLPAGVAPQYWDLHHEEMSKKAEALFSMPVDYVTDQQRKFVEYILGFDSHISRCKVSWILWREFIRNWRQWRSIFPVFLVASLHKFRLIWLIRIVRKFAKPRKESTL